MPRERLPRIAALQDLIDALEPGSTASGTARNLARFLAAIVEASTALEEPLIRPIALRCRRRPGRRPCGSRIEVSRYAHPDAEGREHIAWRCPR